MYVYFSVIKDYILYKVIKSDAEHLICIPIVGIKELQKILLHRTHHTPMTGHLK